MAFPTRGTETDSHALGLKVTTTVDGKNEKTTTYRIKEVDVEHTTDNKNPKYKAFKFKPNYLFVYLRNLNYRLSNRIHGELQSLPWLFES